MKKMKYMLLILMLATAFAPAYADHPVKLHFGAPDSNGGIALLSESGWALNIKMVINFDDFLGYAIRPNPACKTNALLLK